MDTFTLIAEIVKGAAWPVAAIIIAAMARGPIVAVVRGVRLHKLKVKDWEAEFAEGKQEIQRRLPAAELSRPQAVPELTTELQSELEIAPDGAVLTAWKRVEGALHALAQQHGVQASTLGAILEALVQGKVIDDGTRDSINGLRQLRNLAVHAPEGRVSASRARDFIAMADAIIWVLSKPAGSRGDGQR